MMDALMGIAGAEHVTRDPAILDQYSKDESFVVPIEPALVVRPGSTSEVQKTVQWAN
jgi:FAD/FMN-containing dehydrogenase